MQFLKRLFEALSLTVMVAATAAGEEGTREISRWSLEFRYGAVEFAAPASTLPLRAAEPGRYVELSFLPVGTGEVGLAYALSRDSSIHALAGVAFQSTLTTLDVSDSSFHSFREGEFPVATLRISQIRADVEMRAYVDLPAGVGVGMWRAGVGVAYVWGSGANVLEQARSFPGIGSIRPRDSWLLAIDVGAGYLIPGSRVTMTANATLNLQMEFVSNHDIVEIAMTPGSPYRFPDSRISPVFFSAGVIVDL